MHLHENPDVPAGQRLPVLVLISRQARVGVIEGTPEYEDLKKLLEDVLALPGESLPDRR